MSKTHYDTYYSEFASKVQGQVRREAYGVDFGQDSWTTDGEFREFVTWLHVGSNSKILDVASGSGGPAIHLAEITGAHVTGLDINQYGVTTAMSLAKSRNLESKVSFQQGDASQPLPFENESFDGLICLDAINHFPERDKVLTEWYRVLKPDGRLVFTDPIVLTGILTKDEFSVRTGIGYFLVSAPGEDDRLLKAAGFEVVQKKDVTENVALVSKRKRVARAKLRDDLAKIEGAETFDMEQRFYQVAETVARERRLSRFAYAAKKQVHS